MEKRYGRKAGRESVDKESEPGEWDAGQKRQENADEAGGHH